MREFVACNDLWHWPVSSRLFSHEFAVKLLQYGTSCRVRFTTCTVLDGFFPYLAQMITTLALEGVSCAMTFDVDLYLQGHSAMTPDIWKWFFFISECIFWYKNRFSGIKNSLSDIGIYVNFQYKKIIFWCHKPFSDVTLQWRYIERNGVSNHRRPGCLLKRLFRRRSKKTSKLRITGLCEDFLISEITIFWYQQIFSNRITEIQKMLFRYLKIDITGPIWRCITSVAKKIGPLKTKHLHLHHITWSQAQVLCPYIATIQNLKPVTWWHFSVTAYTSVLLYPAVSNTDVF